MALLKLILMAVIVPLVRADGWDDFSNNLATDLAPFLSLFGEQVTKQYLSESVTFVDYFIFAMAPMGIITAIVSAIRICGNPSLRALIGRAQEGGGISEAELCSSTSWDVCELVNNGGIARVFGRPKILEIVFDRSAQSSASEIEKDAGIFTFQSYLETANGKKEWTRKKYKAAAPGDADMEANLKSARAMFAPNLSLNIGIKKWPTAVFALVAVLGIILQGGVLAFAVIVTYYLKWKKEEELPDPYACPLVIIGTVLLCVGVFFCAFVVGESTYEEVFDRTSDKQSRSTIYWLQPGGQILGDQRFYSFTYNDEEERSLDRYMTSWKTKTQRSQVTVWGIVCVTITGFVLQFTGLRGVHSAISLAQLGAIMIMSVARAALRGERSKLHVKNDTFDAYQDQIVGHELDWLAISMGQKDFEEAGYPISMYGSSSLMRHNFWRFSGSTRVTLEPSSQDPENGITIAGKLLAYRIRLGELTESPPSYVKVASASNFEVEMVEVRRMAHGLARVIEATTNALYSSATWKARKWNDAGVIYWDYKCVTLQKQGIWPMDETRRYMCNTTSGSHTLHMKLQRSSNDSNVGTRWKLAKVEEIEAILGLWVWSLKSDPDVAQILEIPAHRIIAIGDNTGAEGIRELGWWLHGLISRLSKFSLQTNAPQDSNTIWEGQGEDISPLSSHREDNPCQHMRLFGWHVIESPSLCPSVWTVPCQGSLLSLCAQEVFASFFRDMTRPIHEIGKINFQEELGNFRMTNTLVSDIADAFTEARIGNRDDALLCVVPTIVSHERRAKRTPLLYAAESGYETIVRQLVEEFPVNVEDIQGRTPLSQAAANGHEAIVNLLLEQKMIDINKTDEKGRGPLWLAAANGHEAIVRVLLDRGNADITMADSTGKTPVVIAAEKRHNAVVKLLLGRLGGLGGGRGSSEYVGIKPSLEQERISENFLGNLDRFFRGGPFSGLQRDIRRNKGTKIALLCTGIEHESIITWHGRDPIVKSRSWVGNKDECGDFDGFGTLATHALLTACHRPRIYIAKVTRTAEFEPNICDIIAEAITWAVKEWDVDIIAIPMGFASSHRAINDAIVFAHEKSKVIFAGAGIQGPNNPRMYPANSPFVVAIHGADGNGTNMDFNPLPQTGEDNFSTLSIISRPEIEVSYTGDHKLAYGPHVALAVACGITAELLKYVHHILKLTDSDERKWLYSSDGVREILRTVSTKKDGYDFISPWLVWSVDTDAKTIRDLFTAIINTRKKQ